MTTVDAPPQLSPADLRSLYEQMVLIRVFETESERQYKAAHIGGSVTPRRKRRALCNRTNASTSSIEVINGAIHRSHRFVRPREPSRKKRKCWWSLLNPGMMLPWMFPRRLASYTGSGSAPGS